MKRTATFVFTFLLGLSIGAGTLAWAQAEKASNIQTHRNA